jgi:SEC-C motif
MIDMKSPCPCGSGRLHKVCCSELAKIKERQGCANFIAAIVGRDKDLKHSLYSGGGNHWSSGVARGLLFIDDGDFDRGMHDWTTVVQSAVNAATPASVEVATHVQAVLDSYFGKVRNDEGLIEPMAGPEKAGAFRLANLARAMDRATKRKGAQSGILGYRAECAYEWLLCGNSIWYEPIGERPDATIEDLMSQFHLSRPAALSVLKRLMDATLVTAIKPRIILRDFFCCPARDSELAADARQRIIGICERAAIGHVEQHVTIEYRVQHRTFKERRRRQ